MPKADEYLEQAIKQLLVYEREKSNARLKQYPQDVPNDVCRHAFIHGFSIENSFNPKVGEYNYLFKTEFETVSVWTYRQNINSALVSEVDIGVKDIPYWKTAAYIIELSLAYADAFESCSIDTDCADYKWMYYFKPEETVLEDITFYNLSEIEAKNMSYGRELKATKIAELSPIIELLLRDDMAYTALSLMVAAFKVHYCCLICELSANPWHDHLAEEPSIWQQASILQNLEMCIVQSCRTVESILGEPPNKSRQGKVCQHKQHWIDIVGIDPNDLFKKANESYLDFYYELFFNLRNPSAHSYGNIHYDLARKRAVEAQCFAAVILRGYIKKNALNTEQAMNALSINREFLNRVKENMSTSMTNFDPKKLGG